MEGRGAQLTCFTGTKAQILMQKALLYWYKSTNTDTEGAALMVQKCKY
jgi:hypothetical protein